MPVNEPRLLVLGEAEARGKTMLESGETPTQLRWNVINPNGIT